MPNGQSVVKVGLCCQAWLKKLVARHGRHGLQRRGLHAAQGTQTLHHAVTHNLGIHALTGRRTGVQGRCTLPGQRARLPLLSSKDRGNV